jgi:type I restriction enzyme S subunit
MRASYPTYKSTSIPWLPEMPEHWDLIGLNLLFRDNKNKNKGMVESLVLSLSYGNIIRKQREENFGLIPESFETYQILEPGYIVLRLTDLQNDKRSLRVGYVKERGIITSAYTGLIPSKVDSKYYYYLLHYLDIRKHFYSLGGGVRQSSDYNEIKKTKVPFPPLTEQTAIANYLDAKAEQINRFIEKKQKLIALLKEQKRSLTTEIIQEEAKNVEKIKLKYCVRNVSVQTSQMAKDDIYLGMENVESWTGLYVQSEQKDFESQAKMFQFNDVLFGKLRPYLAKVFLANIKGVCSGEFLVLRPSKKIAPEYLQLVLLDPEFISLVNSSTFGAKMPRADWGFIGNQLISIPSIAQQKQIVAMIKSEGETIDKVIGRIEKEIEKVKELKQSLIAEAVTGKIKVA